MGAWGSDSFENDTAVDWAASLETGGGRLLEETLDTVLAIDEEPIPTYLGEQAIGAAEVVARLRGKPGVQDSYSEAADRWVEEHPGTPSQELIDKALAALDRVVGPRSELAEAWEEDDSWLEAVEDLRGRLVTP